MPIRREIYVPNCVSQCGCQSQENSERIQVNVGDQFKLVYQFTDSRYNPALLIPLLAFDLRIDYFIKGNPDKVYTVLKEGTNLVNCIMIQPCSIIKSIFSDHGLDKGELFGKFTFRYPDLDFPDKFGTSIVTADTGITLI